MVADCKNETLCINQIIGHKSETIIVEKDFVVPDIKPDILNSINTSGTVCIYKKEIMDGKFKIEGCINSYVMYLAETQENPIRSLNINLDFSKVIDFSDLKIGMTQETCVSIKQIECRVLNGRKVNIRVILDIDIKAYSNEKLDFMNEINNVNDIQLLRKKINFNSLLGCANTKVYAKDTIIIDNIDNLAEILKVNIDIKNKETKISYNKVLIKADCALKIMYLTTDNRICVKNASIPIMGFVDMQDVADDNICETQYEIKNIVLKPNSMEEHSIYAEIEIEVTCKCYTNKNLELIQDLYSPSVNLSYQQNIINTMASKKITKDICQIREKQIIEDLQGCQIYDVDVKPRIINQNLMNDRIMYEGEVELSFSYSTRDTASINFKEITIPFNYNMECQGINKNCKVDTFIETLNQDFIIMPDESIDIKIDLQFNVNSFRNEDITLINQINVEENRSDEKYSIIIYFVKPNDTLWLIAKKFRSTVDAIAKLNQIEDENNLQIGQQLFIPMFH